MQFTLSDIQKERCRRNLSYYIKEAWPIVEPGEYCHNWHIDAICDHLMAVSRGEIRRLIINVPPRTMKSTTVAVMWPTWEWISQPQTRWLFSSYALSLSIRDAQRSRRILESMWYKSLWGDFVQLREDQNAKSYYENTQGGARLSISVGSAATGHGGDRVVCDDPHNAQEAESTVIRQTTLDWWSETMTSRLNNPRTGAFVIVMQRLHERDLTGHLLAQGGYEHLCLPLEYDKRRICTNITWKDKEGNSHTEWKDPRNEYGELLWPDRINHQTVEMLKKALGSYGYASQYQQTPSPSGGGIFKKEWFRYYSIEHTETYSEYILQSSHGTKRIRTDQCREFITVDLAASLKEIADYTVIALWAQTPDNELLLLNIVRDRLDAHDQQKKIKWVFLTSQAEFIDVEASGYQLTMVQQLLRDGLPVRKYTPVRDKVSRARTVSIRYEAEMVFHPRRASWLIEYEMELLGFPTNEHDDQVDVTSRAGEIIVGTIEPKIRDFSISQEDINEMKAYERKQSRIIEEFEEDWLKI